MSARTFVDTNVLIYAHDVDAGRKHEVAQAVLRDLWNERAGVVSTQVLQEFYVNATRKIPKPLAKSQARDVIKRTQRGALTALPRRIFGRRSRSRIARASDSGTR
jgi:predicted nucleic acid-binding protein